MLEGMDLKPDCANINNCKIELIMYVTKLNKKL